MMPVMVIFSSKSVVGWRCNTLAVHEINARVNRLVAGSVHAISGNRRWASASSNSPTSTMSAPSSRVRVLRSSLAFSWLRSIASRLSNVADDTPRPVARLIRKLALQNPSRSSSEGSTDVSVELDGSVDLIGGDLDPRRPHAGAVARAVVAVQDPDLPLVDRRAPPPKRLAAWSRSGPPARRWRASPPLFPRRWWRCTGRTPGRPTDDSPTNPSMACKRGHDLVANVRDPGVDGRGLRLDSGRACVHGPPPLLGAAPRWRHPPSISFLPPSRRFNGSVRLELWTPTCSISTHRGDGSSTSPRGCGRSVPPTGTACATSSCRMPPRAWRSSRPARVRRRPRRHARTAAAARRPLPPRARLARPRRRPRAARPGGAVGDGAGAGRRAAAGHLAECRPGRPEPGQSAALGALELHKRRRSTVRHSQPTGTVVRSN